MTARKVLTALVCAALLATGAWGSQPMPPGGMIMLDYEADIYKPLRYEGDAIPLEFTILGGNCTMTVRESSLELLNRAEYDGKFFDAASRRVDIDLIFDPGTRRELPPEEQKADRIVLDLTPANPETVPATLDLHVLVSPYGTFVNFLDQELLHGDYFSWLLEQGHISQYQHDKAIRQAHEPITLTKEEYEAALRGEAPEQPPKQYSFAILKDPAGAVFQTPVPPAESEPVSAPRERKTPWALFGAGAALLAGAWLWKKKRR